MEFKLRLDKSNGSALLHSKDDELVFSAWYDLRGFRLGFELVIEPHCGNYTLTVSAGVCGFYVHHWR